MSLSRIANSVTPKPTVMTPGSIVRSKTQERKLARRRRTNLILMMVSIVFFLAWAPIHIYLLVVDLIYPNQVRDKCLKKINIRPSPVQKVKVIPKKLPF